MPRLISRLTTFLAWRDPTPVNEPTTNHRYLLRGRGTSPKLPHLFPLKAKRLISKLSQKIGSAAIITTCANYAAFLSMANGNHSPLKPRNRISRNLPISIINHCSKKKRPLDLVARCRSTCGCHHRFSYFFQVQGFEDQSTRNATHDLLQCRPIPSRENSFPSKIRRKEKSVFLSN